MKEDQPKPYEGIEIHIKGSDPDDWHKVVEIKPFEPTAIQHTPGEGVPRRYVTEDGLEISVKAPFVEKRRSG